MKELAFQHPDSYFWFRLRWEFLCSIQPPPPIFYFQVRLRREFLCSIGSSCVLFKPPPSRCMPDFLLLVSVGLRVPLYLSKRQQYREPLN